MIYGKDVALEYPTKDLYDSNIMLQAINAARYDYQTGQDQIKEFNKLYGDFISPIQSDVDYWNRTTIEPVRDALNAMYQQGIDPTRSAEGRALIAQIINNVPTAELNKRRASAKNAEEYLKNRAALQRAGKYNPDYEQFTLDGKSLETWNTDVDGPWMRTSPMEYQTLHDFVDPSLDNIKPYNLSKDEVENEFGRQYDPRYEYLGVAPSRLEKSLRTNLPGLAANPLYDYYRDQAKKDWMRLNPGQTPTDAQILDQFVKNSIIADYERVMEPVRDVDKYAFQNYKHQQDMQREAYKAANAMARARVAASSRRTQGDDGLPDIFHESRANLFSGDGFAGYDIGMTHNHRIVPEKRGIGFNSKAKAYTISEGAGKRGVLYKASEISDSNIKNLQQAVQDANVILANGGTTEEAATVIKSWEKMFKPKATSTMSFGKHSKNPMFEMYNVARNMTKKTIGESRFEPFGQLRYQPDVDIVLNPETGLYELQETPRYFISGYWFNEGNNKKLTSADGNDVWYMEVKQGANNYNKLKSVKGDYRPYYDDIYGEEEE